ncbi:VOC family protein [Actinotalea sp. AC32]|nr:VOC family protein [Actinotalea sp. AC32]
MSDLLPAGTDVDAVTLHVGDLAGQTAYYQRALGLTTVAERAGGVVLGRRGVPVVELVHTPGLPQPSRRQAGLFHTAVLFETEADLAAAVLTASRDPRSQFVGSADHLVSQAFYFTDPEGNGIELYHDRDRSQWAWDGGMVRMATDHLDPRRFLEEHLNEVSVDGITDAAAQVGHVHLQVGDVASARRFYVDALGFEVTCEYPGALFVAAGGYHHHLAVNVWNSQGAGPRASTLGLGAVRITVPTRDELDAAADRLRHRGLAVADDGAELRTEDPWRNAVTLAVA